MDGITVQTSDEIFLHLLESGVSADALYTAVVSQHVEIVLTAHPTQVNRRTLQHKLTCIAQLLAKKDAGNLTEDERRLLEEIQHQLRLMYMSETSGAAAQGGRGSQASTDGSPPS